MLVKPIVKNFDLEHIVPYFQPVMDLQQNAVASYECLARLVSEDDQTFLPSDFLMIIERQQCQGQLTEVMLRRSAVYFRDINVPWSVNISQQDMVDAGFSKRLSELMQDYPNSRRVTLELTAATALNYPHEFKNFLLLCKAMDVRLMLDNFAGSKEELNQLLPLPLDGIKLSGALVGQLSTEPGIAEYIEEINRLASLSGVPVIAEHIEDDATLTAVKKIGIRYGQGFFFSYPQSKLN